MMIMHQAAATMTGYAAISALFVKKKREVKFQSVSKCYSIRKDFVDWCEFQNEELLMNTGSIA